MVQCLAGDADAGVSRVGEIRQRLPSRHMILTEDHLAIGTVFSVSDAAGLYMQSGAALLSAAATWSAWCWRQNQTSWRQCRPRKGDDKD